MYIIRVAIYQSTNSSFLAHPSPIIAPLHHPERPSGQRASHNPRPLSVESVERCTSRRGSPTQNLSDLASASFLCPRTPLQTPPYIQSTLPRLSLDQLAFRSGLFSYNCQEFAVIHALIEPFETVITCFSGKPPPPNNEEATGVYRSVVARARTHAETLVCALHPLYSSVRISPMSGGLIFNRQYLQSADLSLDYVMKPLLIDMLPPSMPAHALMLILLIGLTEVY
jgi:hypothetical protein